jgi:hypothetical protein
MFRCKRLPNQALLSGSRRCRPPSDYLHESRIANLNSKRFHVPSIHYRTYFIPSSSLVPCRREFKNLLRGNEKYTRPYDTTRKLTSIGSRGEKDSPSKPNSLGGFGAIVDSVHKRMPKIEWHLTDLVSVLGIGTLFVSILVLPSVIE